MCDIIQFTRFKQHTTHPHEGRSGGGPGGRRGRSPGSAGRHEVRECNCSTRHRHGEGTSMPLLGHISRAGWAGPTKKGRPRTRGRQQCSHETRGAQTSEPAAPKSAGLDSLGDVPSPTVTCNAGDSSRGAPTLMRCVLGPLGMLAPSAPHPSARVRLPLRRTSAEKKGLSARSYHMIRCTMAFAGLLRPCSAISQHSFQQRSFPSRRRRERR